MLIGATCNAASINYWYDKLRGNNWMRVFPNSNGMIPSTGDSRFTYLKAVQPVGQRTVFVSSKIRSKWTADGHGTFAAGVAAVIVSIKALIDSGFDMVYYGDQHEPEAEYMSTYGGTAGYKSDQNTVFTALAAIGAPYRAKLKFGHILTRTWVEDASKGNFNYSLFDTGNGDFFSVDMYGASWKSSQPTVVTDSFVTPTTFLQYIKAYQLNAGDHRDRLFPELGYIGAPFDTTGAARGTWLQGIYNEVSTWNTATTGWNFLGFIWWNETGSVGNSLTGIGTNRFFQLDRIHTATSYSVLVPPLTLRTYNDLIKSQEEDEGSGYTEEQLAEIRWGSFNDGFEAGFNLGYTFNQYS